MVPLLSASQHTNQGSYLNRLGTVQTPLSGDCLLLSAQRQRCGIEELVPHVGERSARHKAGSSGPKQGREVVTCPGSPTRPGSHNTHWVLVLLILCPNWAHCLEHPLFPVPTGYSCQGVHGSVVGQFWICSSRLCCCLGEGQWASHLASQRMVIRISSLSCHQELKEPSMGLGTW